MNHVLHRSLLNDPVMAKSCEGVYIIDVDGKRYLDACGGAAVSNLGYNNPEIIAAIEKQLHTLSYAHSAFFTTPVLEQLADLITSLAPGMDKALFLSGGSEANEAALKLCRQYFVESGKPEKKLFIARVKLAGHPYVGDIRGRGLFIGIELVQDKASKQPFSPELKLNKLIQNVAMQQGLMCYPMGGTIDGKFGDHILLAPAFIITESQRL